MRLHDVPKSVVMYMVPSFPATYATVSLNIEIEWNRIVTVEDEKTDIWVHVFPPLDVLAMKLLLPPIMAIKLLEWAKQYNSAVVPLVPWYQLVAELFE